MRFSDGHCRCSSSDFLHSLATVPLLCHCRHSQVVDPAPSHPGLAVKPRPGHSKGEGGSYCIALPQICLHGVDARNDMPATGKW